MIFTYSDKEMKKIRIIEKFVNGIISIEQAMEALACSDRTIYRYKKTLKEEGPPGFIHGLRGKQSNHNSNSSKYSSIIPIISKPKFKDF